MITIEDILYIIGFGIILLFSSSYKNETLNKCLKEGYVQMGEEIIICKRMVYK